MSLSAADEEALAAFEAEREAFEQQQTHSHAQQPHTTGGGAASTFHSAPVTKPQSTSAGNPFATNSAQPQKGKVISITRSEVFSGQPRTVMKVLLEKGGERTITADANGNVKIAIDIEVGDQVKLAQVGPMQMEWNKVSAVLEKVRKKRKLFNIAVLLSQDGLPKLYNSFPSIAWETRPGYETRFLTQLVTLYKTWAFALWPKMSFQLFVDRVEKLGTKMQLKDILSDMRYGKIPDWSMYDDMDDNGETNADREAKKTKNKVQLNPQAEEIFNALTMKRPLGQSGADGDADGIDDDDEDAIMAALADKYSQKDPSSSGKGGEENIHALQAKKRAMELERQRKDEEEYALMQARYEEEQELDLFARPGNIFTSSNNNKNSEAEKRGKKRARVLEDEEDEEEEAVFAPMASQAPVATQEEAEATTDATPAATAAPVNETTPTADATDAIDAPQAEGNVEKEPESTSQQMDTSSDAPVIVPATASAPTEGSAEPMANTADEAAVEPASDNNNSAPVIVPATNDTTQVTEAMQVEETQTQVQVEGVRSATPPTSPSREGNTTVSQEASLSLSISQTQQQEEMLEGNMDEFLAEEEAAEAAAAANETSVPAETNHDSVAPTTITVAEAETQAVTQRFSPTAFFE